jgi:Mn-dependent DtxR family transcriptional regulator
MPWTLKNPLAPPIVVEHARPAPRVKSGPDSPVKPAWPGYGGLTVRAYQSQRNRQVLTLLVVEKVLPKVAAKRLGIQYRSFWKIVKEMRVAGLLVREGYGRYQLTEAGLALLDAHPVPCGFLAAERLELLRLLFRERLPVKHVATRLGCSYRTAWRRLHALIDSGHLLYVERGYWQLTDAGRALLADTQP